MNEIKLKRPSELRLFLFYSICSFSVIVAITVIGIPIAITMIIVAGIISLVKFKCPNCDATCYVCGIAKTTPSCRKCGIKHRILWSA